MCLVRSTGVCVDECDTTRLASLRIDEHLARRCVGPQREMTGVERRVNESGWRIEGGVNVASSGTTSARASTEALAAVLVVFESVGGDTGTIRRQHAIH